MPEPRPGARPRADDRGRPPLGGPPRPPFRPGPRVDAAQPLTHTLRLRDGERELEVSGSAAFIRQVIDDIPDLWARMHGQRPAQPSTIRMPRPPSDTTLPAVADEH
jgi:hypothetical protein